MIGNARHHARHRARGSGSGSGSGPVPGSVSGSGSVPGSGGPGARSGARPRLRRLLGYGPATLLALCAAAMVVVLAVVTARLPPSVPATTVAVAVPYWNVAAGSETIERNPSTFTEVSPWLYGIAPDGRIEPQTPQAADSGTALAATGLPVVATVANVTSGTWAYQPVADVLRDPARRAQHVNDLVELVLRHDYAGVDIDYEDLRSGDRHNFSTFVASLADDLHSYGRTLSVAVFAKQDDAGYDERNLAQDYAAIGRAADQIRLMTYDYHWPTSPPGPVAPADWVRGVLDYARSQIPAQKIVMGLPVSGYDWVDGLGSVVSWQDAARLALHRDARVMTDPDSQTPWFRYTDDAGRLHEVWFEDADSTAAKLALARQAGIGGVFFWLNAAADERTWTHVPQTSPARAEGKTGR